MYNKRTLSFYDGTIISVEERNMTRVKVTQGWLQGELLDLVTGEGQYYSFKGIPYAAPPIGNLRFKVNII